MQQRTPKWELEDQKTSVKNENKEDDRYAQVMKEIEDVKQELGELKLEMTHVLNEKKQAEKAFEATSSKISKLSSSMGMITKEIEELDEEQVLAELARIEAVNERELIETQRTEEAKQYQTLLEEVKKKAEETNRQKDTTHEFKMTLCNVNSLEHELEAAKMELAAVRRGGFSFMASMDVVRNELKHVQEEKARLEKEDEARDLPVQNINTKILKAKAKLEDVRVAAEKANMVASNLSLTIEQLHREAASATQENALVGIEVENIKSEGLKTESEIDLWEKRLEAAMNELVGVKSSEFTALKNLKNVIDTKIHAHESALLNNQKIKITDFEYEYLTGHAGRAEEVAAKKVAAAQAWVAALKANEKEVLMKVEMGRREMRELGAGVEEDAVVGRRRSVDAGGGRGAASPRRSVYRVGNVAAVKRGRSHLLLSPATRHAIKSSSFTKRREKVMQI